MNRIAPIALMVICFSFLTACVSEGKSLSNLTKILADRRDTGEITPQEYNDIFNAILQRRLSKPKDERGYVGDFLLAKGLTTLRAHRKPRTKAKKPRDKNAAQKDKPSKEPQPSHLPDKTPREIADSRLALGEITIEQHQKIIGSLENSKFDKTKCLQPEKVFESEVGTNSEGKVGFVKSIFGKYEKIEPTSDKPYKVNRETFLYDTFLVHKGKRISYDLIEGLDYDADSFAVNAVTVNANASLKIIVKGQNSIYLSATSAVIKGYKMKAIGNAYSFLIPKSYKARWNKYVDQFKSRGYILVGGVKIYPNGDVTKKDRTINLKDSHRSGHLVVGTSFMIGSQGSRAPDEVVVGDGGTSAFSRRIVFNITKDKDVLKSMIQQIANS